MLETIPLHCENLKMTRRQQVKDKSSMPFFMNRSRLQTSESYFSTNYRPEKLYEFDYESDASDEVREDLETLANQGYYGMPRFLPLKTSVEDEMSTPSPLEDRDEVFIKEVNKWMGFSIVWLTVRRLFTSAKEFFWKRDVIEDLDAEIGTCLELPTQVSLRDTVSSESFRIPDIQLNDIIRWNALSEVDLSDSDDSFSTIYADETGNIQQFRITTPDGRSANVVQFSVGGLNPSIYTDTCQEAMDLKSLVLSQNCASLMWVWNQQSCIVLITESSDPCCWSVQQWFRKILSDMALADSIMIGHPYYWHPIVRRKLRRAMKHFKKLYKLISLRKSAEADFGAQAISAESDNGNLELMCCKGVTQVTIAGDTSHRPQSYSNEVAEDIVTDLCDNWTNYHRLVRQNKYSTVDSISDEYFSKRLDLDSSNRLQSTTFLSFSDSDCESIPPPNSTTISSLNEVKGLESGTPSCKAMKGNVEGDHATDYDKPLVPLGFEDGSLESRWNDKAFKKPYLAQNMKATSSDANIHKKRSKASKHRQRKLRE